MPAPHVSVCVPTRNHARYLGEALASALDQDVEMEVLVHDDASDDDTQEVVAGLADERVRYMRHPEPLGVAENRNTLVAAARGRYLAWLDSDDAYLPGGLARQLALLDENPEVGLAHGAFAVVDERGGELPPWPAPFDADAIERPATALRHLIASNEITTSTVVVRRACQERAGAFRGRIGGTSSDWEMWLRLALRSEVAYAATPVARYRQHDETISRASARSGERLRCDVRVVKRVLADERSSIPDPERTGAIAHAALAAKALLHAGDAFTSGRRGQSLQAIGLAAQLAPANLGSQAARLCAATVGGDDYEHYRTTKEMLARLAPILEGTRYGRKIASAAATERAWDATLACIAATMRRVLPVDALVATVAKWDPTLLRLSRRRGRQFPDRRLMPDGYPAESAAVIEHLEALRREGLSHIVFPSASFWWLDHYEAFELHLERRYTLLWRDEDCVIYGLAAA